MSTLQVTTITSNTANTPPIIRDSNNTEIGTFCRAWVTCNGSSTILASFNVSSVTDTGTGGISVNFATAFSDANYASAAICRYRGTGSFESTTLSGTQTTTALNVGVADIGSGAGVEVPFISVVVFR